MESPSFRLRNRPRCTVSLLPGPERIPTLVCDESAIRSGSAPVPMSNRQTQHRTSIKPKSSSDERDKEKIMTKDEFTGMKRNILSVLRHKDDAPPRSRMAPGAAPAESTFFAVNAFLKTDEGSTSRMVRGYKLFTLARDGSGGCTCYVAKPHAVIENVANGKFTCLVKNPHELSDEFIFVPSSLMHKELSDEELCSGRFMLCDVIGGDTRVVADITSISSCMSRFEQRRLTTRPGQIPAPPAVYIRYFPGFSEWFSSAQRNLPGSLLTDIALSFGMPFRPNDANEPLELYRNNSHSITVEAIDVRELTHPNKPFEFERQVWLPSVSTLHQFYDLMTSSLTDIPQDEQFQLYEKVYNALQNEYWCRLKCIGRRNEVEAEARVHGQWK